MSDDPPPIRDAATLILLRPAPNGAFEILLLRRDSGHEFMADAWVFPGGALDDGDRHDQADPFRLAAIRETYEESGLLLARPFQSDAYLRAPQMPDPHWRQRLYSGEATLMDLVADHHLSLALDALWPMAHWITPPFESRRYDTHFFVARAPTDQRDAFDPHEMSDSAWWSPTDAIDRYRDQSIRLAPPTLRILERLRPFDAIDDALAHLSSLPTPPSISPVLFEKAPHPTLLLPGDPLHPADATADDMPQCVTRMILRDGQWYSEPSPGPE